MRHIIMYIACLFVLTGCSSGKQTDKTEREVEYKITYNDPTVTVPALDLFREISYLPLETNDSSLLSNTPRQIIRENGYLYITDINTKKEVYIYDLKGKYVRKISRRGEGPEEYIRIEDFDVYTIDGRTEIWISDNKTLKIYDAKDMSFLRHISFDFLIYKFKRLDSSHILLVTGNREKTLTLTDANGEIIADYLDKEFPFLMFRPVQFISWGENLCYQLGVSNAIVAFDTATEQFSQKELVGNKEYLSSQDLLDLYKSNGMEFLREMKDKVYINQFSILNDNVWIHSNYFGKPFLTKIQPGTSISSEIKEPLLTNDLFNLNDFTFLPTLFLSESAESLILYMDALTIAENEGLLCYKNNTHIRVAEDDNPCLVEFYP